MSKVISIALTVVIALSLNPGAAFALDPGMPTFRGAGAAKVPVPYTVTNMMQAIYNSESDGTDFWMDRMLARPGVEPPQGANDLLTKGRCLFMKDHDAAKIGFGGATAYMTVPVGAGDSYVVEFSSGPCTEDTARRVNGPSYWTSAYRQGDLQVLVRKFIAFNNTMVTCLTITNGGAGSATLSMVVSSPYATAARGDELTGTYPCYRNLITVSTRLSGDGMAVTGSKLTRKFTLEAGQSVTTKVQMAYLTPALPESQTEYVRYREHTPDTAFAAHVREYNRWWVDNIPYIDLPDPYMKKLAYYRFWLNRYNFLDANLPGASWGFPTSVEGIDGYNNSIPNSVCYHIQDDKYFRDPLYAYGTWLGSGENAENGMYRCDPASEYWGNTRYENFTSQAGLDAFRVHGGTNCVAEKFAAYAENDTKGQLARWSGAPDLLTMRERGETGMDDDAISFEYYGRGHARVESAYAYAGFVAAQSLYALVGNEAKAREMAASASRVQTAVLSRLWDNDAKVFKNRDNETDTLIPWKEGQVFTPFSMDLVPTNAEYRAAFRLWTPATNAFLIFPFHTSDQSDRAACLAAGRRAGNNFAILNSAMDMMVFLNGIRKYPSPYLTPAMFKQLLTWAAWAQCIDGDATYPDANEFWNSWNPATQRIDYRSWIHHNVLGSYTFALVEGIGGLVPRMDRQIELWPIDVGYEYFTFNNLRYHGSDLTIVWDSTGKHYGGPAGYSIYLNGRRMLTVSKLVHLIWNASDGSIAYPDGGGATTGFATSNTAFLAANQVALSGRIVSYLHKAGVAFPVPMPSHFTAYNDCAWKANSASTPSCNDAAGPFTTHGPMGPASRHLSGTNGEALPVQVNFSTNATVGLGFLERCMELPAGTDAERWFAGRIGTNCAATWHGGSLSMTFTGLDTGKRYNVVLWSTRGADSAAFSNRFTDITISGAADFTNCSSAGTQVFDNGARTRVRSVLLPGHVARYDAVRPSAKGTVTFTLTAGADRLWPDAGSATNGYLNAFLIQTAPAPRPVRTK